MALRAWPAWFGLWAGGVVGLLAVMATPEALSLRPGAPVEVDQVAATGEAVALVPWLSLLLLPLLVGVVCWHRRPLVVRACLVLAAFGLGCAALAFRGMPDVGPGQVTVTAAFALVAAAGAVLGPGASAGPGRAAGLAAPIGLALLASGLVALVWAGAWMLSVPMLDRHEESESGWSKLPSLLVGSGMLAAAAALARRWWGTAAASVTLGCATAAALVAGDPDQWRLPW